MNDWLGANADARWVPFEARGQDGLVCVSDSARRIAVDVHGSPNWWPLSAIAGNHHQPTLIGTLDGIHRYTIRVGASEVAPFEPFEALRPVLIGLSNADFLAVSTAVQIADFVDEHQFCGRCGGPTQPSSSDRGRVCAPCALSVYPRLAPCVIVLITRGSDVLLARSPRFVDGMYSTLAGFVEAGESAEQACHREIFEEVGVTIGGLAYQGSQSWPFRHSLMLGYRAEWRGGNIAVDGVEIVDAQWFSVFDLPKLPPQASISRSLIDSYTQAFIAAQGS